jgi:hypothetical protein
MSPQPGFYRPKPRFPSIEHCVSHGDLAQFRLTAGLKGYCPDEIVTLFNNLTELGAPSESQNDQGNDKGEKVVRFVGPKRQLSNVQLPHWALSLAVEFVRISTLLYAQTLAS